MERRGGTVDVRSSVGKGTEIRIHMPRNGEHHGVDGQERGAGQERTGEQQVQVAAEQPESTDLQYGESRIHAESRPHPEEQPQ